MNTPATGSTRRDKTRFVVPLLLITTTLLGLGVFELILSALLWYPPLVRVVPAHLGNMAVRYYDAADRAVVQGMESCAQYDSRLFYTLKPGTCVQTEREFSVAYAINSQGLRDSETALTAPRMIVIGDSFAMGWGVAQQSAFAKLVEAEWGHSVLNAGISSYGTARETSLLNQLDLSALEYVVVQYCDNDVGENHAFIKNGYRLLISSRETYQEMVNATTRGRSYFPGDRLRWVSSFALRWLGPPQATVADDISSTEQARLFLEVLSKNFAESHPKVKIMAFELNTYAANDPSFASELERQKASSRLAPNVGRMVVEDFSTRLNRSHTFDLDSHLRPAGHRVVADAILSRLKSGW